MAEKEENKYLPTFNDRDAHDIMYASLSAHMREKVDKIPPEYLEMTDEQLKDITSITKVDEMLRTNFWLEMGRVAREMDTELKAVNIYSGVCSRQHFLATVQGNKAKLAYVIRPPRKYEVQVAGIIDRGVEKLREALDAKVMFSNGHMDAKGVKVMLDIVSYFESRTKGSVKQRIELESKSLHVHAGTGQETDRMDDLDAKLLEVKKKLAQFEGQELVYGISPEVVDVEKSE